MLDKGYYRVICATFCVNISSKSKATNVFSKHILKLKARDQSIQARKKLFCHVIVKNWGGFRVKIPKKFNILNLVVLSISDYVENNGKLDFCQNLKIGLKLAIENRCYCFWVLNNHIATVLGALFSLFTGVTGLGAWFTSILVLFHLFCRRGFDIWP